MKYLIVGDPHAQPKNLSEMESLLSFIESTAKKESPDRIVLMGDLQHFMSVVRVEVQNFWLRWLPKLAGIAQTIVIRGNHDQSSHQTKAESSLLVFSKLHKDLVIIESPTQFGNDVFIPYYHHHDDFKMALQKIANPKEATIWMHQTVDGSHYEGGFYAPDGLPMDLFADFKNVISGHIHTAQSVGKVWYVGTPKWDTKSDANEEKGVWIWDSESNQKTFVSTKEVVTPIYAITLKEGEETPEIPEGTVYLTLEGSGTWIAKTAKKYKSKCRIVPKPTDSVLKQANKSMISSFDEYLLIQVKDESIRMKISEFVGALNV